MFNPLLSPERTGLLEGFWHFSNSPLNLHFCPTLQGWRDSAHNARSQPGSIQVHQEMLLGGPPLTHSNAGGRTGHSISVMPWRFAPVFSEGLLCGKPLTNINQPSPVLPEIGGIEILLNCRRIIDNYILGLLPHDVELVLPNHINSQHGHWTVWTKSREWLAKPRRRFHCCIIIRQSLKRNAA